MPPTSTSNPSYFKKVAQGAAALSGLRFTIRCIGLLTVSISARLLTPDDFGVHSSVALLTGFFLIFQAVGVQEFLVKTRDIDAAVINTAWTVRVLVASVVTSSLLILAPFTGQILGDTRIPLVFAIFALNPFISSLENPRIMLLLRDMRYGELFKIRFIEKLVYVFLLFPLILILENYWALTLAVVIQSALFTVFTHLYWKQLPKFDFTHIKAIGGFGGWSLLRAVSHFVSVQADSFSARQFLDSAVFGAYHNSKDAAKNLVYEMSSPIATAFFPALSRLREDPTRFRIAIQHSLGAIASICFVLGAGLNLTAREAVLILLGDQWTVAIPYVAVAGLIMGVGSIEQFFSKVLLAADQQRLLVLTWIARALVAIPIFYMLISYAQPMILLYALLAMVTLHALCLLLCTAFVIGDKVLWTVLARPSFASATMLTGSPYIFDALGFSALPLVLSALAKAAFSAAIFITTLYVLWLLSGRPECAETVLISKFRQALKT